MPRKSLDQMKRDAGTSARRWTLRASLAALREGRIDFAQFVALTGATWERAAGYFLRRWPGQAAVCEEDLRQEILLAAWQAVRAWDPERGVPLHKFVWYATGVAATKAMKRTLRYSPTREQQTIWTLPLPREDGPDEERQEKVAVVREALAAAADQEGLESEVAAALLDGRGLGELAQDLYDDPASRWRYWLCSEQEAESRVRAAAGRLARRNGGAGRSRAGRTS